MFTPTTKENNKNNPINDVLFAQIKNHIRNSSYEKAISVCNNAEEQLRKLGNLHIGKQMYIEEKIMRRVQMSFDFMEFQSLKAYCLINVQKIGQGIEILQKCIQFRQNNPATLQRLAYAHSKQGNIQQALKYYNKALIFQPDNVYLTNLILKLQNTLAIHQLPQKKDYQLPQTNHNIHKQQQQMNHQNSNYNIHVHQIDQINNKQHVTFGTMEVIEINSDNSDQFFAHIKQEISKLGQAKPKKSILKMSKSLQKNTKTANSQTQSSNAVQKEQIQLKKSISIKSCSNGSALKWQQQQKKEDDVLLKKQKKKKKSVSMFVKDQDVDEEFKDK